MIMLCMIESLSLIRYYLASQFQKFVFMFLKKSQKQFSHLNRLPNQNLTFITAKWRTYRQTKQQALACLFI